MKNINNNEPRHQDADELLKDAISLWKKDGYYDDDNENSQFYNIGKDPIVKLFMIALSHQTNNIKDEIFRFKENLLEEFTEKIIPYYLIKPIPAFSIIQTAKEERIENECFTSAETPFILEKEKERGRSGGKENERFQFVPLLKTKIIKAHIFSVHKMDENRFKVTMECCEQINDLSGLAFFFTTNRFTDLSITLNDKVLPLIKPGDYANLPFTEWFDVNNMLFDQSMIYGNKEFWMDIFAVKNLQYYIVDHYDSKKISSGSGNNIEMVFEFTTSDPNFNFDSNDVKINCVPIVNVEKQSVTLSHEDPIRKIATEKNFVRTKNGGELKQESAEQKQFLNLFSPSQPDYERNDFTLRRFGMERFNKNELLIQINSILNKFSSDYYAFMTNSELKDGDKIKNLYLALKEVADELKRQENPGYGIYLILNQSDTLSELKKTINVSYLLTDGTPANGINPNSVVQTDIQFDVKETRLIMETAGGNDMEMNNEIKNRIAQYYFLTKDRLVTKADIRLFCYKELSVSFAISKEFIEKIDIRNEFEFSSQEKLRYILIEIRLNKAQSKVNKDVFSRIENQLKKMIEIRSANLFPIRVSVF